MPSRKLKIETDDVEFGVTFSAGVAAFPVHGSASEEILIRADAALYRAKELGRDQAVIYSDGVRHERPKQG